MLSDKEKKGVFHVDCIRSVTCLTNLPTYFFDMNSWWVELLCGWIKWHEDQVGGVHIVRYDGLSCEILYLLVLVHQNREWQPLQ
jgi:hypothetical protein